MLRFDVKAGPTGSLFGSVTTTDIADEIWRTRKIRVDRRKIGVDTIKRIGRYTVPIDVFEDVVAEVKLMVVPEGGELPPEEELAAMEAAESRGGRRGRRRRRPLRCRGASPPRSSSRPTEVADEAAADESTTLAAPRRRRPSRGRADEPRSRRLRPSAEPEPS